MKAYVFSFLAGILIGLMYSWIDVPSPAPPAIALLGLLGILVGEQVIPVGKKMFRGVGFLVAWREEHCNQHVFGPLPTRASNRAGELAGASSKEKRS
jgi:XapX domain-containing protein